MRPRLSWSDLAGRRVGVWGLGVEGRANLHQALTVGALPVAVDGRLGGQELEGVVVVADGDTGRQELARCDVVVKSPGISRYRDDVRALEATGIPVLGGLGLWLEDVLEGPDPSRVVCVTGTKGKSTTSAMFCHLLQGLGRRCFVGGNLGLPPYAATVGDDYDHWVIETSSYQATDVSRTPPLVVVTSLSPDHLEWHGAEETYFRDKLSLCTQPGAAHTIANGDSSLLRSMASLLGPTVEWTCDDEAGTPLAAAMGVLGRHNRRNALLARAVLRHLGVPGADDEDALVAAARGFDPLPSRLALVGTVDGVDFVDDCLSTNALPTIAALEVFEARPVALIVGGRDRGIDYRPLGAVIAQREVDSLVIGLGPPDNGPRILHAIGPSAGAVLAEDLPDAVEAAYRWARPRSGVVLLSPAAPTRGHAADAPEATGAFVDYREKAACFAAAMERYRARES